jgi:hypothetical protein
MTSAQTPDATAPRRVFRPGDVAVVAPGGLPAPRSADGGLAALAAALGLPGRPVPIGTDPAAELLARRDAAAPALLIVGEDPGLWRPEWRMGWCQVLADFQQPTLLMVSPTSCGAPGGEAAAYTALLRQCGVPLLGLVQNGGPWRAEERRCDGLPWCGCLGAAEPGPLADVITMRRRELAAA